ncbi:hypothetical protein ABQ485_22600 [Citrobacter portucalensis]|uniref:Uncharacterized protein n=1 Tax=Citrobacter portucalensis TaxID=1639133 RepID=A0AAW5W8T4_9ENTR|nr:MULTISPECIES: hypothetical protein [Citrobacter]MCX9004450.1 hypothetical protein [Citrobacter portucalensis]MEB1056523.1 hypothetical protein [Citrobacter portucalensis]
MALAIFILQLVFNVGKMPRTELNLGGYVDVRFSSGDSRFSSRDDRREFIILAGGNQQNMAPLDGRNNVS